MYFECLQQFQDTLLVSILASMTNNHKLGDLKEQKYCLIILEATCLKSRCQQVHAPSDPIGKDLSLSLASFWWFAAILIIPWFVVLQSLSPSSHHLLLCVSVCVSFKDSSDTGLWAHPTSVGPHLNYFVSYI